MFRGRRGGRGDGGRSWSAAGDLAVSVAEGVVRQAWGLALLRWRDRMEFERRAAEDDCAAACDAVAAALRDGGPEWIAAAHAVLDGAVETALSASLDYELVRRKVRRELDLLAGKGDGWAVDAHPWRPEGGDPPITGRVPVLPAGLTPRGRVRYAMWRFKACLRRRLRQASRIGRS